MMNCVYFMFYFPSYYLRGLTFVIEGLTARIKPNRTSFVFESALQPNITCESDCENYNWMCIYKWMLVKNNQLHTYIDKNNSRIDIPLKENVTLRCYVEYEHNRMYDYSKEINIFIKGKCDSKLLG